MRMRHLVRFAFLILLAGCGGFDTERMFNAHVVETTRSEVRALKGGKVSCLHCPMYFAFEGNQELTTKIISAHRLQHVVTVSEDIRRIAELVKREAPWWEIAAPEKNDKVYWIEYKPKQPVFETAFRLLVVRGNKLFFITSGFFNRANYQDGKS